jgi:hypothetical protein
MLIKSSMKIWNIISSRCWISRETFDSSRNKIRVNLNVNWVIIEQIFGIMLLYSANHHHTVDTHTYLTRTAIAFHGLDHVTAHILVRRIHVSDLAFVRSQDRNFYWILLFQLKLADQHTLIYWEKILISQIQALLWKWLFPVNPFMYFCFSFK